MLGGHYDKTLLLLLGQELARVSVVLDETRYSSTTRSLLAIGVLASLKVSSRRAKMVWSTPRASRSAAVPAGRSHANAASFSGAVA